MRGCKREAAPHSIGADRPLAAARAGFHQKKYAAAAATAGTPRPMPRPTPSATALLLFFSMMVVVAGVTGCQAAPPAEQPA